MDNDLGRLPDVTDVLAVLQTMSETDPLGVRWSAGPVSAHLPSVTMPAAPGLSLSVSADGFAHLRGDPVSTAMLRRVHQKAVILHQLLNGRVVLHGSAVAIDGTAVATIGPSRAGKSTTAAALVHRGGALLADDVVAITDRDGRPTVLATESRLRLKDVDASGPADKKVDPGPDAGLNAATVARVEQADLAVVLVLTCEPSVRQPQWSQLHGLAALDALREFGAGPKGLDILGPAGLLQGLARVAAGAQVWRLRRSPAEPTPEDLARELERLVRVQRRPRR